MTNLTQANMNEIGIANVLESSIVQIKSSISFLLTSYVALDSINTKKKLKNKSDEMHCGKTWTTFLPSEQTKKFQNHSILEWG